MSQTLAERIEQYRRDNGIKTIKEAGMLRFPIGNWYMFIHKEWWDILRSRDLLVQNFLGQWIPKRATIKELGEFDVAYSEWQRQKGWEEDTIKKYGEKVGRQIIEKKGGQQKLL